MKYIILLVSFFTLGCGNKQSKSPMLKNDTTEIIDLTLKAAFYHENLPSLSAATKATIFKDSVLLTADTPLISYLPNSIDNHKFKVLDQNTICSLLVSSYKIEETPNFLKLTVLKKNDSGYFVIFQSLGCHDYSGGGTMGLEIVKKGDSLKIVHQGFSNLN